ncbi:betaine/proline/choline family ABC transporter ATP-binding protein [Candidatus Bipolaricaulota bacterium]|nr:betaine/proline/choline family ABC transporter ATP-binding protein [Candidatus Bipolaricaulota bacterium]
MPSIELEGVYKIFGEEPEKALEMIEEGAGKDEVREKTGHVIGVQDISFKIKDNELFVIMGLSGSGKSTLLRCVNRLVNPTKGTITLHADGSDYDITAADKESLREIRETQVSMVFQNFALFPHRTVAENVSFGLEIQGVDKTERNKKAKELIEVVGLEGFGDSFPSQLSGGMQQRVGLARGLATGAEVLLMDEPFSALDPLIKVEMQNELLDLMEEMQRTVLFVTHDLDEALKVGDRITIMDAGRMVQKGTPEEIIVNPKTEYVADFVENADPSDVLRAETVAEKDFRVHDHRVSLDEMTEVEVNDQNEVVQGYISGTPVPVRPLEDYDSIEEDAILYSSKDTPISKIMRARLAYSSRPVLVLRDKELIGFVKESNILQGLLEKGRGD